MRGAPSVRAWAAVEPHAAGDEGAEACDPGAASFGYAATESTFARASRRAEIDRCLWPFQTGCCRSGSRLERLRMWEAAARRPRRLTSAAFNDRQTTPATPSGKELTTNQTVGSGCCSAPDDRPECGGDFVAAPQQAPIRTYHAKVTSVHHAREGLRPEEGWMWTTH